MTLALGLVATLVGADLVISGITKRPFTRLLFGNWDAPNSTAAATAPVPAGTAATGGAYASGGGNAATGGTEAPGFGPGGTGG